MQAKFSYVLTAAIAALVAGPSLWAAGKLSQAQVNAIVVACQRVENDYALYRDRRDADAFANIFTADGEWGRSNGNVLKGHKAIHDYIVKLAAGQSELHMQMTTTIQITPVDATTATGVSYAMVMQGPIPKAGQTAINGGFQVASESRSTYKLINGECKIAKRDYTTLFVDAGEARKNEEAKKNAK